MFQYLKGVISATSGYSGGSAKTAEYVLVSTGDTGHAGSVKIIYDPSKITYGQLLRVFFSVAHDPTQLNRHGPRRRHPVSFVYFLWQPRAEASLYVVAHNRLCKSLFEIR